jgi:lipid-binding SYLF domain-containing protein
MRMRATLLPLFAMMALGLVAGCEANNGGNSPAANADLDNSAKTALAKMEAQDPGLQNVVDNADGYAIFPEVGQGAVGVGAANGKGVVYEHGQPTGFVDLKQVSVGLQLGGQTYTELIVFKNKAALDVLKSGHLEFGADASATAVKAGAAASGQFNNGTRIFILPKGGLMAGIAINGQKFDYTANNNGQ